MVEDGVIHTLPHFHPRPPPLFPSPPLPTLDRRGYSPRSVRPIVTNLCRGIAFSLSLLIIQSYNQTILINTPPHTLSLLRPCIVHMAFAAHLHPFPIHLLLVGSLVETAFSQSSTPVSAPTGVAPAANTMHSKHPLDYSQGLDEKLHQSRSLRRRRRPFCRLCRTHLKPITQYRTTLFYEKTHPPPTRSIVQCPTLLPSAPLGL